MNNTDNLKRKSALWSLSIGFIIFFLKVIAFIITGSSAILSDALESIVHIFATSFAYLSLIISLKPPDESHPYGHGKIEYFSSGFEGALIIIAALSIILFAIEDLLFGVEVEKLDVGGYLIFSASLINLILGLYLIKVGKKTNSIILTADGKHILTDSITSIAVIISIILVLTTGWVYFDPIIALLVAFNIIFTGYNLVKDSVRALMQGRDEKFLIKVIDVLNKSRDDDMIEVHKLRTWSAGNNHYIDFHLIIPNYYSIEKSHQIQNKLTYKLRAELETNVQTMIHFDPCKPEYCKYCSKKDCIIRSSDIEMLIEWDLLNCTKESIVLSNSISSKKS